MIRPNLEEYTAQQLITAIPKILTSSELTPHESQALEDLYIKIRKVTAHLDAKSVIDALRTPVEPLD